MKKLIFSILISISFSDVQIAFIYDSCTQNNNLYLPESPGGTIYFSQKDKNSSAIDHGNMNNSIFNCLIVLRGKSQGYFPYKRFFGIHFRLWKFDTNSGSRYNETVAQLYYQNVSADIKSICGDSCKTGCMQLIHPEYKTTVNLCGANQLTGTDYTEYFQQDYLMLKFYLLGGVYLNLDVNSTSLTSVINRTETSFIIDFFSFYFGKCTDLTTEFQCIYTDRCIDINLKCDITGGMDCGISSGRNSITYDESVCYQSSTTSSSPTSNSMYLLFILFCLPFIILLLLFLCYRPGYCCWRCARLRNCSPISKSQCAKKCTYSCVMGKAPNFCQCCKSAPKLAQVSLNGCICCCRNINNIQYNNLSTNKIMPYNSTVFDAENENTLGDGYHLRECR